MHTRIETKSPRSKLTMSLFPNILHTATYSTILGDRQKSTSTPSRVKHEDEHQTAHEVDHHKISAFLISFLSHMFAPAACQQCTSSTPCWATSHYSDCASKKIDKAIITVDDVFALLEHKSGEE